jgi:hypothetical protein
MMSPFESQLIAVVIFGLIVSTLPRIINKWADSRSQRDEYIFLGFQFTLNSRFHRALFPDFQLSC